MSDATILPPFPTRYPRANLPLSEDSIVDSVDPPLLSGGGTFLGHRLVRAAEDLALSTAHVEIVPLVVHGGWHARRTARKFLTTV